MGTAASIPGTRQEALAEGYTEEEIAAFEKESAKKAAKLEMDLALSMAGSDEAISEAHKLPKPDPMTFGFEFPGTMFAEHTLDGTWDSKAWKEWAEEAVQNTPEALQEWAAMTITEQRPMVDMYAEMYNNKEGAKAVLAKAVAEELEVDTTPYPPCDNAKVKVLVFRPPGERLGIDGAPRPAMVFGHPGPGCYHSASLFSAVAARYAVDFGLVVFSVDYRKAPEHKAPAASLDALGVHKYIRANAEALTIDPDRIVFGGDSGGGTALIGAAVLLARSGEAGTVKLVMPTFPLASDLYVREGVQLGGVESIWGNSWHQIVRHLRPSPSDAAATAAFDEALLFPSKMGDETAAAFPTTVIITSEFDVARRSAEELAMLLHKHGRLGDFLVHPGVAMDWHLDMDNPRTGVFWADTRRILDKFVLAPGACGGRSIAPAEAGKAAAAPAEGKKGAGAESKTAEPGAVDAGAAKPE